MCRVSGSVNHPESVVQDMMLKQYRGGPDFRHSEKIDEVVFGHNLLSIVGYQEQPMVGNRYMMTFNGCWYDYKDYYPYLTSDTAALSAHFERKGLKALDDVNGMFSIGLYDKTYKKIHLIVDRFGQKPMYYTHQGDKFAFASNPAALYPLIKKQINKEALQSYWLLGSVMGEESILYGINKVTASQIVTYDIAENKVSKEQYYEPKFQENTSGIEELVYDAIDKVKVADVPIHIFLSGGVDSTLVASRFRKGKAIHLDSPEYIYAQEVANRFEIDMIRVFPEDIDVHECLSDYSLNSGEPSMAALIPYITSKEVSKYGRVAITANGADELFFGYDRTHDELSRTQSSHIFRLSSGIDIGIKGFPVSFAQGRYLELQTYVQYDLNKTLDSASMCHGLEVRSPFLDHRLVEMALSIPEEKHRKRGNKTILKNMLRNLGFKDQFVERSKLGFSIHKQPENMDSLLQKAWLWVRHNGFLDVDDKVLSGRDYQYLRMSALGFYNWYHEIMI